MSAPNRKGMGLGDALLVWLAIGFIVVFGGGTYAAAHLGSWMAGIDAPPAHPIDLVAGLIKGRVPWPVQSTVAAALMAGVILVLAIVVLVAWKKGASKRARVDKAARYLGRGKSLAAFSEKGAKATAERLGVKDTPGIVVGKVVSAGQTFIQSWEDLSLDIWGPRTGKSTSRVMPAILDAPGAVVSTSNKRDVVDGTRGVREATAPVWVFDPQKIAQEGILQSWSQGVELWGEANMRKIWSAANVKVYGGGVAEEGFLRALSDLIGDYSYTNVSISSGKSGSSRSRQESKERIFDVSNLAELDRGRAVVLASGAPATLLRTMPWCAGPRKDAVEASIKKYSPRPEQDEVTLAAASAANPWVTG